jgi:hypothetical protein
MEIIDIMEQMTTTYGRPTPTALLQSDTLFRSPYLPIDAPKVLFRRIEDCQEIMTLGDDPYTPMQLMNNAIRRGRRYGESVNFDNGRRGRWWRQHSLHANQGQNICINKKTTLSIW